MLKFVEEQRASKGQDGSYELNDSHDFTYEALSKELCVGNVYLRVYNDQPDFEISEPEDFCVALVDFVSFLIHSCNQEVSVESNKLSSNFRDEEIEPSGNQSNDQNNNSDDASDVLDEKITKEDNLPLKNLTFALNSLKVHLVLGWRAFMYVP